MDRRAFIRTGMVVPVALAAALSAACRAPAPTMRATSTSNAAPTVGQVAPTVAPVVGPGAGAPTFVMQHPVLLLDDLVGRTSSQVASNDVEAWLATRAEAERAEIVKLNAMMAEHGFSDRRDPRVFTSGNASFYVLGNVDGRNACAPFWVNGKQEALVEGPAILGLTAMARDWTRPGGVTPAQGLVPVGTLHRDKGAEFGVSFPYPYVYKTAVGQVSLNYQIGSGYPNGFITVSAERDGGGELFARQGYVLKEG
jgi:hypothetical protein